VAVLHTDLYTAVRNGNYIARGCVFRRLVALANNGEPEACWLLGLKYEQGSRSLGITASAENARNWFRVALRLIGDSRNPALRRTHGRVLSSLAGVTGSHDERAALLNLAVELGDSRACEWKRHELCERPQLSEADKDKWDWWHRTGGDRIRSALLLMPDTDKVSLWLWQNQQVLKGELSVSGFYLKKKPSY
jgi:hypothetical protein